MDAFAQFNYLVLDASTQPASAVRVDEPDVRRERVDVIARQFADHLLAADPADDRVRGFIPTNDFQLRGHATKSAGWLAFFVDRGRGKLPEYEEVARLAFARADGDAARDALAELEPHLKGHSLPAVPFAVTVQRVENVPSVIREWMPKAAAGFFSEEFSTAARSP